MEVLPLVLMLDGLGGVKRADELKDTFGEAVKVVLEERQCMRRKNGTWCPLMWSDFTVSGFT